MFTCYRGAVSREEEMNGITFLTRQEGKGSREWDLVFSKIKNVCSGPSRWEEETVSEDTNGRSYGRMLRDFLLMSSIFLWESRSYGD